MPEKAEPFGFRKGSITVTTPPIHLSPEIIMPDITMPDIKMPDVTVQAPVIKFEPVLRIEPAITVQAPQGQGWRFTIHKLKNGDIEMLAKPIR